MSTMASTTTSCGLDGKTTPLKLRSMVGLIPLFAVEILEEDAIHRLPGFRKRMHWFLRNRGDLYQQISLMEAADTRRPQAPLAGDPYEGPPEPGSVRTCWTRRKFLSPHGIRSLSKDYENEPYVLEIDGERRSVNLRPGESTTGLFGGNSNWRGPVWFPDELPSD